MYQVIVFLFRGIIRFFAFIAKGPDETLGQNSEQGIRKIKRIHPHIDQPDNRLCSRVGMQGTENQMTG